MSEFLQRFENEIQHRRLVSRRQKILVAVSGGADSMVLLHALHSLAPKNRWQISVAHFNHRLRARASDADEKLVRQTAKKLRLQFFGGGADVKKFAAQSKISVEMAARKMRHEFLARTAKEQKISTIALAHHADDQVELFFLRLLRGAGGEGLAGMKWRSPSPADAKITLVRPLLGFSKAEIRAFAREAKISFREDTSNFSTDFLRNRIRNELLPLLRKKYQPGLDKTVLRLMDIVGAEAEFVARSSERQFAQTRSGQRTADSGKNPEPPHVGSYSRLALALQRKVLQQQLMALGIAADFELIEQLREFPDKPVTVAAGVSVQRDAAGNVFCSHQTEKEFNTAEKKLVLTGKSGAGKFGGRRFGWEKIKATGFRPKSAIGNRQSAIHQEFFDADKIGGEITLRHWRAGDRFQPIGLKSAVKLQDLFVNAKIPAARRRELVLATTVAGEIFWVEGLRIGEKFKLTPQTKNRLLWRISKKK